MTADFDYHYNSADDVAPDVASAEIEFFDGLDTLLQASDTLDIFPKTGAQRAFAMS